MLLTTPLRFEKHRKFFLAIFKFLGKLTSVDFIHINIDNDFHYIFVRYHLGLVLEDEYKVYLFLDKIFDLWKKTRLFVLSRLFKL